MIWEFYQQGKIVDAKHTADKASRKVEASADQIKQLTRHVERLSLACQSMWELLREKNGLTEEELEQRILEVDLRDGQADGKMAVQTFACEDCGRQTNSKRSVCVMCGAPVKRPSQFQ